MSGAAPWRRLPRTAAVYALAGLAGAVILALAGCAAGRLVGDVAACLASPQACN